MARRLRNSSGAQERGLKHNPLLIRMKCFISTLEDQISLLDSKEHAPNTSLGPTKLPLIGVLYMLKSISHNDLDYLFEIKTTMVFLIIFLAIIYLPIGLSFFSWSSK